MSKYFQSGGDEASSWFGETRVCSLEKSKKRDTD